MIDAARHTKLAEVIDTYPTAPQEVSATVRAESDALSREALILLALCGVTVFGTSLPAASTSVPTVPVPTTSWVGARTTAAPQPTTNAPAVKRVPPSALPKGAAKAQYDEDMLLLLNLGLLRLGQKLIFEQPRKNQRHIAFVESGGGLRFQNTRYVSPSGAAVAAAGRSSNGWISWRTTDGRLLDDLRKQARKRNG